MRQVIAILLSCVMGGAISFSSQSVAGTSTDELRTAFQNPASEYRPHAWWHWMSGEVSKAGITKDLEGMKVAGIRGATIFELGGGSGRIFDTGKNKLFSDEWKALIRHTLLEAERLDLELGFHYSPGWSGSGGPWVSVEDSMKELVHSSKEIDGGKRVTLTLEKPKHYKGFYRDITLYALRGHGLKRLSENDISGHGLGVRFVERMDRASADLAGLSQDDIIDLSSMLHGDRLEWDAPRGQWTLLRLGYTSTGTKNRVARKGYGSGLETDKFDVETIEKAFYDGVPGHIIELEKKLGIEGFKSITMDSWEVGYQNWGETFTSEFEKRRGYAPQPYLPVLAGVVVESIEVSQRFLWDCRRTYAELVADTFGATIRKLSNRHGKKILIEPYRHGPFHSFDYGMHADIVMSEFWKGGSNLERVKSVASIAHVRGDKEHRAEAFTTTYFNGGWRDHPWQYKMIGDRAFCYGLNSVTFHSSVHQPLPDTMVPGMSMGRWGAMVNRKQTWWPMAPAYMNYLTRCHYLLRSGDFVGDVLFVTHEHMPNPLLEIHPELSAAGYDYDIVSPSFFIENARIEGTKVHLPGGMKYELVVFPQTQWVTQKLMDKIDETVRAGVPSIGFEYVNTPSLENYPEADGAVRTLGRKLMDDTLPNYFLGAQPLDILAKLDIPKDFEFEMTPADAQVNFIHHKLGGKDLYFVANTAPKRVRGTVRFRVGSGQPSLWNPVNGEVRGVALFKQQDGITEMQLELDRWQSVFVLIDPASEAQPVYAALHSAQPLQKDEAPKLEIIKGMRGLIFNPIPAKNEDITEQLRALQQDNRLVIDEPPGEGKSTNLIYRINGEEMFHSGRLAEKKIHLVAGDAEANPLPARVRFDDDRPSLEVCAGGTYTLQTAEGATTTVAVPDYENELDLSANWMVVFQKNRGVSENHIKLSKLKNLSEHEDFDIRHYSGILTYKTTVELPESFLDNNRGIDLQFEKIANMAAVEINGIDCGVLWARPYSVDVVNGLKPGRNEIVVRVANSWSNRLIGDEYFPREVKQDVEGALREPIPNWAWRGNIAERPEKRRVAFTTNRFYTKNDPLPPSGLIGDVVLKKWIRVATEQLSPQ